MPAAPQPGPPPQEQRLPEPGLAPALSFQPAQPALAHETNGTSAGTARAPAAARRQTQARRIVSSRSLIHSYSEKLALQRGRVGFAGADADGVIESGDEDLAVADLAGLGGARDGLDHLVDLIGWAGDLELDLRQEADGVFGAAIDFGMALLAPVALHLGDGQSLNAALG